MGGMKTVPRQLIFLMTLVSLFVMSAHTPYAAAPEKKILAFGDSLTAGYGLPYDQSFPAQLEQTLRAQGYAVSVINAGVSGDTSTGGLARLGWTLRQRPDFVILELGANDMLRGADPALVRHNLDTMLKILHDRKIPVLLAGMQATTNLGQKYAADFDAIYPALARKYRVLYYPFFLKGVWDKPALRQP
ncbi:MAG: arylesterase, partial [Alphaproteobacteria bacterium]|nr:arylesterase [Alphaproteobacteria bacterium]